MPLYIELAKRTGRTKQAAVKSAVRAKLDRLPEQPTFREKLEEFYSKFPLPEPTGKKADKAFFDELWGEGD